MSEKNLPIKVVLQKATDTQKNKGGGDTKFFGDGDRNFGCSRG